MKILKNVIFILFLEKFKNSITSPGLHLKLWKFTFVFIAEETNQANKDKKIVNPLKLKFIENRSIFRQKPNFLFCFFSENDLSAFSTNAAMRNVKYSARIVITCTFSTNHHTKCLRILQYNLNNFAIQWYHFAIQVV